MTAFSYILPLYASIVLVFFEGLPAGKKRRGRDSPSFLLPLRGKTLLCDLEDGHVFVLDGYNCSIHLGQYILGKEPC